MSRKRRAIIISSGITIVLLLTLISCILRLSSNISYLFDQNSALLVKSGSSWIQADELHNSEGLFTYVYREEGIKVTRIKIRRENRSILQRLWEFILPSSILVFEFAPQHSFSLIADKEKKLNPINAHKAMKDGDLNFVVNTSFYGKDNSLIGELIIDGNKLAKDNGLSSGFFKVVDQVPRVGPRSLFANLAGNVSYSCQAHPSVMRNGQIFQYINAEIKPYHSTWKRKTYRNLIGEKENGNIIVILSNRGALLSVKEISLIASLSNVRNASLFDGGAALQYKFRHNQRRISFSAFNNSLHLGKRLENSFHRRTGIQFTQKSPVYLGINAEEKN